MYIVTCEAMKPTKKKDSIMKIKTFEIGKTYYYRFACSSDTIVKCTVTKRTAKTITYIELDENKTYTKKIRETFGVECVSTGSYSMAPTLYADKVA